MGLQEGSVAMGGHLDATLIKSRSRHRARSIRIPGLGRIILTSDPGEAAQLASEYFSTNLTAEHRDGDGKTIHYHDLGSGLTTNVGALSLANDFNWAAPSGAAINTLKLQNFHAVGTGVTAAAATDIALQTLAAPTTTTAVTGAQSLISAANVQKYQTVATVNFTGAAAITEWGLHNLSTLSASTGTPFTSGTATTGTVTATPLTASTATVQGQQQTVFKDTTNATPFWGLVTSNTTSVITVPAWYKVVDGTLSASNPANADAYVILPVMWDHKVFAAINVVNLDSIVFTYQLTVNSGG